jgi:hypothetical protein
LYFDFEQLQITTRSSFIPELKTAAQEEEPTASASEGNVGAPSITKMCHSVYA